MAMGGKDGYFFKKRHSRSSSARKSLNYGKRLRDHQTIVQENENFLRRLQRQNSTFNVLKWNNDEMGRQKVMHNITCYRKIEEKEHIKNMESTVYKPWNQQKSVMSSQMQSLI
jgi:hypothetical protein